jgi:hypothetical protein
MTLAQILEEGDPALADSLSAGESVVGETAAVMPAGAHASAPQPTAKPTPAEPGKETPRERRAREAREKRLRDASAKPAASLATGTLRLAVSPWGQVEVDGTPMGTAPPLNELSLPEGRHQIVIRNGDAPPYSATVNVSPGQPVTIKHRFGS